MTAINPDNVLDQFDELIPDAADHGETYLRGISKYLKECRAPVSTDVREVPMSGGMRAPKMLCLISAPTEKRLRHFEMVHYGTELGTSLKVGWYLLGGTKSQGLGGWAILGGSNQMDMDNLKPIVQLVHQGAVVPAMHETAAAAGFGGSVGNRPRSGFFGN